MEGTVPLPESEDKGLRGIEDGMSMVLDTKNSSLQNATKLIFATKRVVKKVFDSLKKEKSQLYLKKVVVQKETNIH